MTGNDLVRVLRKPGKVWVPMLLPSDVVHVVAEKSDLIAWAKGFGDTETHMRLDEKGYLDVEHEETK